MTDVDKLKNDLFILSHHEDANKRAELIDRLVDTAEQVGYDAGYLDGLQWLSRNYDNQ